MSMDPPTGGSGQSENPLRESLQISAIDDLLSELDGAPPRAASPAPAVVAPTKADDRNSLSAELDAFLEDMAAPITTGSSSTPAEEGAAQGTAPDQHAELKTPRTLYEDLEAAIADADPRGKPASATETAHTEAPAAAAPEQTESTTENTDIAEPQAAPDTIEAPVETAPVTHQPEQPAARPRARTEILNPEDSPFDDIPAENPEETHEQQTSDSSADPSAYVTDASAYSDADYSVSYATEDEMAQYGTGYATESVPLDAEGYAGAEAVYGPSANALELNSSDAAAAATIVSSGRNWNQEFLALRSLVSDTRENTLTKCRAYKKLADEFIGAATSTGTRIIEENWLSVDAMTIKPVQVGGVAGGRKYIANGIFFKFALDSGMYGSDENAAKAAALELKAVNAIFENYEIIGLGKLNTVPIVLINYLGYRLIATPVLPVNSSTLAYGSADAGTTVHTSDNIINKEMEALAARLNLAPHLVGKTEPVLLAGPVDIEGHLGTDGNRYVLDTARLMPPEAPGFFDATMKAQSVWIRHMRPEAVVRAPAALNSDAYTGFNKNPDVKADRDAVASYTSHIYGAMLPAFAAVLHYDDVVSHDFVHRLHDAGLNVRMLGHIRKHAKSSDVKKALMERMLARAFKSLLYEKLRRVKNAAPGKLAPFHKVAADMLSLLVCSGDTSDKFWADDLLERVRDKFGRVALEDLLSKMEDNQTPADTVRANITTKVSLLLQTLRACGIQLIAGQIDQIMDDSNRLAEPISPSHIAKLLPVTKVSSNVYGEEGWRADTNLKLLTGYEHLDPDQVSSIMDHFESIYGEKSVQVADALAKIMAGTLSEVADDKLQWYMKLFHAVFAADFDFLSRTLLELRQDDAYWVPRLTLGGSIKSVVNRLENILGVGHPYLSQVYLSVSTLVAVIASRPNTLNVPEQFISALPENPAEDLCDDALIYMNKAFEHAAFLSQPALAQLLARAAQAALKIISIFDAERPISATRWTARLEAYFGKADSPVVASFECGLAWILSTSRDRTASADIAASVPAQRALHVLERLYGVGAPCTVHVNALLGIALSQDSDQTSKDSALIVLEQMLQHMESLFTETGSGVLHFFPYFEKALYAYRTCSPATGYDRLASFEEKIVSLLTKFVVPFRPQAAKIAEFYSLTAQSHRASSRVVGASGIELDGDEAIMLGMQANAMMSDVSDAWDAVNGPYGSRKILLIDSTNRNRLYAAPAEKRDALLLPMTPESAVAAPARSHTTFNGEWIKGRFAGTATVEFSTLMKALTGIDSVFGSWQEGLPHGMARIIYVDGSVYEGPVNSGVYEGKGIMTNPDGSKYAGPFVSGLMHGSGFFLAAGSTTPVTKHYRRGKETNPDLRARYVTPQRKVSMPDFGAASRVDIPVDSSGTLHGVGAVSWGDTQFCLGVWRRGVLESAVFHTMDGYLSYTIYTSHVATLFFWNRVQTHFGGLFSNPNPAFLPGLISVVNQLLDSMQNYWTQPIPDNLVGVELDNLKENKRGWEFGVAPLLRTSAQVFSDLLKGEPLDLGNLLTMMTTDVLGSAQKLTEPKGDQPQTGGSPSQTEATPSPAASDAPAAPTTPAVAVSDQGDSRSGANQALSAAELEDALAPLRRRARAITPGTPRPPKVAATVASAQQPVVITAAATAAPAATGAPAAQSEPTPATTTPVAEPQPVSLAPPSQDGTADRVPSVTMVSTVGAAVAQDQATPRTPRATTESVSAGSGNSTPAIVVQSDPSSPGAAQPAATPDRRPSQANPALAAALRKSVQVNPATLSELFKQEAAAESDNKPADPATATQPASPTSAGAGQTQAPAQQQTAAPAASAKTAASTPGSGMSLAAQAGGLVRQQDKVIILGLPPMKQTVQQQSKNVEGWLHKRGNRGLVLNWTWKWRFFRISDDSKLLLYFKHKEVDANKAKGKIELAEVDRLEENKDFMCAFNVHIKGRTYVLQAQSLDQRKMWLTELQKRCPKVTTTNSFENMHSSMLAAVPQFMRPVASGGAAKSSSTPPASPRPAGGSVSSSSAPTPTAPAATNVDATSGAAAVAFSPSEPVPSSRPATQDADSTAQPSAPQ